MVSKVRDDNAVRTSSESIHPSIEDNKKVAKVIIDTIMKSVGWDTTSTTTVLPLEKTRGQFITNKFLIDQSGNFITVKILTQSSENVSFISLNGKELLKKNTDESGMCSILKSSIHKKGSIVGNKQLGWRKCIVIK